MDIGCPCVCKIYKPTLYGTANRGGGAYGTLFKIGSNGSVFTKLRNLSSATDGAYPEAALIVSGNTLYGTAAQGGIAGRGTIFKLNIDGTGVTNLHSFTNGTLDGSYPRAGLALLNNTLYGTTEHGGSSTNGTVFAVGTDSSGFAILHSFSASTPTDNNPNSDGANPFGGVILSGSTLYGTTSAGGTSGYGALFSLTLAGPQVSLNRAGAEVIITWPTNAVGYSLQFTTNLVTPIAWSPAAPVATVVNGQNTVTNAVTGTQKFYRLSQ